RRARVVRARGRRAHPFRARPAARARVGARQRRAARAGLGHPRCRAALSADRSARRGVIDTHAHLDPAEAPAVLDRARAAGVDRVVVVATTVAEAAGVLALAEAND